MSERVREISISPSFSCVCVSYRWNMLLWSLDLLNFVYEYVSYLNSRSYPFVI